MNRRVLIVDDDVLMVATLAEILEIHGWKVQGAHRGEDAIEAATRADFDIVVMDVGMPGMDGVTALKAIVAERPELPLVLMTGYSQAEVRNIIIEREDAPEAWVERVITKPFPPDQLVRMLEDSVERRSPSP